VTWVLDFNPKSRWLLYGFRQGKGKAMIYLIWTWAMYKLFLTCTE